MSVVLDTNILIRLADTASPQRPTALAAMAALRTRKQTLHVVPQVLYEFWVVATRPKPNNGLGLSAAEAGTELSEFETAFLLIPDPPTLYAEWRALVLAHDCKGKVAHDARIAAAMRTHGLTDLLTFNGADFRRFPGVTVLDPAAVAP